VLTPEDRLNANDGICVADPLSGLGFQTLGALERLGRRTLALCAPEELPRLPIVRRSFPWQQMESSHIIDAWTGSPGELRALLVPFNGSLAHNVPVDGRLFEKAQKLKVALRLKNPELHAVFVVSGSTPEKLYLPLLDARTTVLLAPRLFGLKDGGLFDWFQSHLERGLPRLLRFLKERRSDVVQVGFLGDVAALLSTLPQNPAAFEKLLFLPPQEITLEDFGRLFLENFLPGGASATQKFRSLFSDRGADFGGLAALNERVLWPADAANAFEIFPGAQTPVSRALRQCRDSHRRYPEMDLIFGPARAL